MSSRWYVRNNSTPNLRGNIILAISLITILLGSTTLTGTLLARTSSNTIPQEQQQALKIWSDSLPGLSMGQSSFKPVHTSGIGSSVHDPSSTTNVARSSNANATASANDTKPSNVTAARSNFTTIRIVQNFTNIRGPVKVNFVNSYWTYNTAQDQFVAGTTSSRTPGESILPVIKQEVGPGEGQSLLAVVLINEGFSAITGITSSLQLPQGFEPVLTPEHSSIPRSNPYTALSSYDGVVNPGGAFTLYFPVKVLSSAQAGNQYTASMKLGYVKVTELRQKQFRTATITVPFKISGKVILDVTTSSPSISSLSNLTSFVNSSSLLQTLNLIPGNPNAVKLTIRNVGSATARGVIVSFAGLTSTTPSSTTVTVGTNVTTGIAPQAPSSSTVILGSKVFNIGSISPGGSAKVTLVIYPSIAGAGTVQTLNLQVAYNDAYGNKKSISQIIGLQILPISPQSGLSVTPSSPSSSSPSSSSPSSSSPSSSSIPLSISPMATSGRGELTTIASFIRAPSDTANTETGISKLKLSNSSTLHNTSPSLIQIAAGRIQNVTFAINNDNAVPLPALDTGQNSITDLAVSLTPQNSLVKILGPSSWNIPTIASSSGQVLSTQVFAPVSLMNNPVVFTVVIKYIQNDHQVKSANFDLGAMVVGDIQLKLNDLRVEFNGSTPTLVGNILNEGNTPALYASVEMVKQVQPQSHAQISLPSSSSLNNNPETFLTANSTRYLGNIVSSFPRSFSMPLQAVHPLVARSTSLSKLTAYETAKDKSAFQTNAGDNSSVIQFGGLGAAGIPVTGTYPVLLKITYSDSLKNIHQLEVTSPLEIEPKQPQPSSPWSVVLFCLLTSAIAAGIYLFLRLTKDRRKTFTTAYMKLMSTIKLPTLENESMKETSAIAKHGKRDGAPFQT
jgi:hypothetical protein